MPFLPPPAGIYNGEVLQSLNFCVRATEDKVVSGAAIARRAGLATQRANADTPAHSNKLLSSS